MREIPIWRLSKTSFYTLQSKLTNLGMLVRKKRQYKDNLWRKLNHKNSLSDTHIGLMNLFATTIYQIHGLFFLTELPTPSPQVYSHMTYHLCHKYTFSMVKCCTNER